MIGRKTFTVDVTPEQDAFIRNRLKSGRFSSVSAFVRAGLRILEREEFSGAHSVDDALRVGGLNVSV